MPSAIPGAGRRSRASPPVIWSYAILTIYHPGIIILVPQRITASAASPITGWHSSIRSFFRLPGKGRQAIGGAVSGRLKYEGARIRASCGFRRAPRPCGHRARKYRSSLRSVIAEVPVPDRPGLLRPGYPVAQVPGSGCDVRLAGGAAVRWCPSCPGMHRFRRSSGTGDPSPVSRQDGRGLPSLPSRAFCRAPRAHKVPAPPTRQGTNPQFTAMGKGTGRATAPSALTSGGWSAIGSRWCPAEG